MPTFVAVDEATDVNLYWVRKVTRTFWEGKPVTELQFGPDDWIVVNGHISPTLNGLIVMEKPDAHEEAEADA